MEYTQCKIMLCSRCRIIIYTKPAHLEKNHKCSYCSDSAPVKANLEPLTELLVIGDAAMPFDAMP